MAKTVTTIMPTKPIYASEATETAHKRRVVMPEFLPMRMSRQVAISHR